MTKTTKIEDILKERSCGRGIECADWHGVCPEAVDKALSQQKDEIKKDLLKIADKGELEQLRVEILNYFKN